VSSSTKHQTKHLLFSLATSLKRFPQPSPASWKKQAMADQQQLSNPASAPHVAADPRKNPCLVVTADHTIRMDEAPIAEPGEGEVLIHVRTTGICGSDLHFWKHGGIGSLTVDGDCILGHEAAGVVMAKGSGVDHLEIGV
jgi:hypothetical protein